MYFLFQMPEYLPEDSETDKADDKVCCVHTYLSVLQSISLMLCRLWRGVEQWEQVEGGLVE